MKHSRFAQALGSVATFIFASNALAWDSETVDRTRSFPVAPANAGFDRSKLLAPGKREFAVEFIQDALGGTSLESLDGPNNTALMSCPHGFVEPSDVAYQDISQCGITVGRLGEARYAWARLRMAGDSDNLSEHTAISRAAADRAGLLQTKIFEPFWVRYATQNSYLASPYEHDPETGLTRASASYIVGQSFLPTGGAAGGTHAARSVSLLEVAQFPDFVSSLADWATGAELCPLAGTAGAYEGPLNDACHQFENALGAVNVTHFKPLARAMWRHYHGLALQRMAQCGPLHDALEGQYVDYQSFFSDAIKPISNYYTEAHECVREAMMYEMFGQHFLQDAWSTGHMWKRFGVASLDLFPATLPGEDAALIPLENLAPRRAAIATLVAAVSGTIHGAKAIVQNKMRSLWGGLLAGLADTRLADDPLCGPSYRPSPSEPALTRYVEWDSEGARHSGGGDLFWNPITSFSGTVSSSDTFTQQRDRMLNCSAKSMIEVFDLAPELFGLRAVTPFTTAIESIEDVDTDDCFGQYATNQAMLASVGVFDAAYLKSVPNASFVLKTADTIVNGVIGGGVNFPRGYLDDFSTSDPRYVLAADRDKFEERAIERLRMDYLKISATYALNEALNPLGTQSAEQPNQATEPLTVFGVGPMSEPSPTSDPRDFGVKYADRLLAPDSTSTEPLDRGISRVFWRGNVQATCRGSAANDGALLYQLKADCMKGQASSGDADACTECTWRAEALIPPCGPLTGRQVKQSGCELSGAFPDGRPSGLPEWWFDNDVRWDGNIEGPLNDSFMCHSPFYVARAWCTDIPLRKFEYADNARVYDFSEAPLKDCRDKTTGEFYQVPTGTVHTREATFLFESRKMESNNEFEFAPGPWLPMFVTARHRSYTEVYPGDPCETRSEIVDSDDILNALGVAPANLGEYNWGFKNGPQIPHCGNLQRMTVWQGANASCESAKAALGYTADTFNVARGETALAFTTEDGRAGCYIKEPRTLVGRCPGGEATCNAGWQCVPGLAPPAIRRIERPLSPTGWVW